MQFPLRALAFIATAMASFSTFNSTANAVMGDQSTVIVHRLRESGIQKIGDISLANLEREIRTIRWLPLNGLPPKEITRNRHSAYYEMSGREVHESMQLPPDLDSLRTQLELHESLGALGYPDQQYQFTTALSIIDGMGAASINRTAMIKEYGSSLFKYQQIASMTGGSSVGGGGDITGLDVKTQVLKSILASNSQVSMQFLKDFPSAIFEPFYDSKHQIIWFQYFYRSASVVKDAGPLVGAAQRDGYQELIKLHFPSLIWQNEPIKKPVIIDQLAKLVLSLYPSSNNYERSHMVPNKCDPAKPIAFPVATDPGIETVQYLRVSALMKCEGKDGDFAGGDWSIRSPGGNWLEKRWE